MTTTDTTEKQRRISRACVSSSVLQGNGYGGDRGCKRVSKGQGHGCGKQRKSANDYAYGVFPLRSGGVGCGEGADWRGYGLGAGRWCQWEGAAEPEFTGVGDCGLAPFRAVGEST